MTGCERQLVKRDGSLVRCGRAVVAHGRCVECLSCLECKAVWPAPHSTDCVKVH